MKPQTERILEYLIKNRKIMPLDALDRLGCYRLASRISELRRFGFAILTRKVKTITGKYVAEYSLVDNYILTAYRENKATVA